MDLPPKQARGLCPWMKRARRFRSRRLQSGTTPIATGNSCPDRCGPTTSSASRCSARNQPAKTTLSAQLARHYDTVVAPEYGRFHTEAFGAGATKPEDMRQIVMGHLAGVAAASLRANRVLIEDTDPVLTAVWSDTLAGSRDPWFDTYRDYPDLYLFCDIDLPWVDDGTLFRDPSVHGELPSRLRARTHDARGKVRRIRERPSSDARKPSKPSMLCYVHSPESKTGQLGEQLAGHWLGSVEAWEKVRATPPAGERRRDHIEPARNTAEGDGQGAKEVHAVELRGFDQTVHCFLPFLCFPTAPSVYREVVFWVAVKLPPFAMK